MIKQLFILKLLLVLLVLPACNTKTTNSPSQALTKSHEMNVTLETMEQVLDAFNRHDLDAILEYFSEDCSFDFPRGPEPWGQRFIGKAHVREALASRFRGIPDVHYGNGRHWISTDGNRGVSEWLLSGTTTAGVKIEVQGCDLWEFRDGRISRKDSYWKIVEKCM